MRPFAFELLKGIAVSTTPAPMPSRFLRFLVFWLHPCCRKIHAAGSNVHTLVSNGAVSSLPQFLAEHRFRGWWDQERNIFFAQFELLATTGGSILLSASLTPAHRFVAHEVAEELLLESESHGEGAARRLMVWSRQ
mmetsp:Transcript_122373/g.391517  ORF Transcript_122373/g.391517 Transcript_122373/m.391517 type:complete len:136 (+) Transcript_122373:715-1122(+)